MSSEWSEGRKAAYAANPAFHKAAEVELKQLLKEPNRDEKLSLYSLLKVGCNEDLEATYGGKKAPSPWNLPHTYKKSAWEARLKENLTAEQAQERYIAEVETLREKYGFDPDRVIKDSNN